MAGAILPLASEITGVDRAGVRHALRERPKAGRAVLNGKVVGAFATTVILHALWEASNLLGGTTFVGFLSLELLSLLVAVVSLTLLIRRVREASSAATG